MDGPNDGLEMDVNDEIVAFRFKMTDDSHRAYSCEFEEEGLHLYVRDLGDDRFQYAGVG
jgi:hypothetical protein